MGGLSQFGTGSAFDPLRARKRDDETVVKNVVGTREEAGGFKDGAADQALLSQPTGVTCFGKHLYWSDAQNHRIRVLDLERKVASTVVGSAGMGFADGPLDVAKINKPRGLIPGPSGDSLYFAGEETTAAAST